MTHVDVWVCRPLPVTDLAALLTADELAEAETVRHEDDRRRSVTGRALLRAAVAARAAVAPASVHFARRCGSCGGPHGKPYPVGADVPVSLTHVGAVVAVAVAARPVGVDVDGLDAARFAGFADVALHPRERLRLPDADHVGARIWVRKEALLKVTGTGLARDPRSVDLGPSSGRNAVVRDLGGTVGIADLDLSGHAPGFVGAVAVAGRDVPRVTLRVVASLWDVVAPVARTPRT